MQTTKSNIIPQETVSTINTNTNTSKMEKQESPPTSLTADLEKQKIEEINKKEYLIEHYVQDERIIQEYKELFAPIKKRLKYTFYFNVAVCTLSLMYAKNLGFYLSKYFPNMSKSLLNLVLFSSVHAIGFSAILIGGNLAILGVNPKSFLAKYREIDEKIMATDPYKDLTLQGFIEGVSEGFNKKIEKENPNENNSKDNYDNKTESKKEDSKI